MNKNDEYISNFFRIISKLKKMSINVLKNNSDNMRPSEEMFLIKINLLANEGWTKVSDLVNFLKLAPSTVSTILKSLEGNGYIVRQKGKDNHKEVFVSLTNEGKIKLKEFKTKHLDKINDLRSYLGEEDAIKLLQLLERITSFLEEKHQKEKEKDEKFN